MCQITFRVHMNTVYLVSKRIFIYFKSSISFFFYAEVSLDDNMFVNVTILANWSLWGKIKLG